MTEQNLPEGTSDRVADRVKELTGTDREANAKARIAALTGQTPEEVPEPAVEGDTVYKRQKGAFDPAEHEADEGVTMTRDVAADGTVTETGTGPARPGDTPAEQKAAIEAEMNETRPLTPEETAAVTEPTREADEAAPEVTVGEHDGEWLSDALRRTIRFGPAHLFHAPAPTFERIEPTFEQRVEALAQAKAILGAIRPTGELVYAAEWLLGGSDTDDEEPSDG